MASGPAFATATMLLLLSAAFALVGSCSGSGSGSGPAPVEAFDQERIIREASEDLASLDLDFSPKRRNAGGSGSSGSGGGPSASGGFDDSDAAADDYEDYDDGGDRRGGERGGEIGGERGGDNRWRGAASTMSLAPQFGPASKRGADNGAARRLSRRLKTLGMKCGRGLTQACVQRLMLNPPSGGRKQASHGEAREAFKACQKAAGGKHRECNLAVVKGANHTDLLRKEHAG